MKLGNPFAVTVSVVTLAAAAAIGACSEGRDSFRTPDQDFSAEPTPDAETCGLQCSRDGRRVLDSCTGAIAEECPDELACGGATCQEPCAAAAADQRSDGCDFYFQAPPLHKQQSDSCYAAFVVNTAALPVELVLERDGEELDISGATYSTVLGEATLVPHPGPVAPGESVIVFASDRDPVLPPAAHATPCPPGVKAAHYWSSQSIRHTSIGKSFRLKTTRPVALSTIYPFGGADSYLPSATLIHPVVSWSKENVLINGWEVVLSGDPLAQIVAAEDDTKVTIHPRKDLVGTPLIPGSPAGVPVTYTLHRGEFLQITQKDELTGSFVVSDKPTSIFGGHQCANIPSHSPACDTMSQQIPSFEHWGSEYASAGYRPRIPGDEQEPMPYRIVAARDGTRFEYEPTIPPGAPTELQAGESAFFPVTVGTGIVVRSQGAEHPFYLAAYMTGCGGDYFGSPRYPGSMGDPEFVNVAPTGQYLDAYSFYADPTYDETSLVIVRQKSDGRFHDVWLDCAGNLEAFRPLGSRGEFEYTRVDLGRGGGAGDTFGDRTCTKGLHRMRSEGPFTATVWGWDRAASYASPGGVAHRKLVDTPLVPLR
ncbi:MAG: IgGFc-binding protein [Labilithrix sp.]|nr:IgGFc-binding protein [Labilithrix sp.]MBX3212758.1 IgGFc-binding protein [Labilithrix sp.]